MTQRLPTNEYALYAEMGFVSFVITVPLFIWNTTKEYNGSAIFDGLGGLVVWSLLWSLFYSPSVIDNVQRNFMVYILIFIAIQLSFLFIFKDRCKGKAANY
jgi:hypothetical protein